MGIGLLVREEAELLLYRMTIRKIRKSCDLELKEARTNPERDRAEYRRYWETLLYSERIEEIGTLRLLRKADRFDVRFERPAGISPLWRRSSQLNCWCLTPAGCSELKKSIRTKRRQRRAGSVRWASLTVGCGSLAAAISLFLIVRQLM
jgi:hypothetical protein